MASSSSTTKQSHSRSNSNSNSLSEWPTDASSYQLEGKIGQGAFASVYKAKCFNNNKNNNNNNNASSSQQDQQQQQQEEDYFAACAIKILNLDHIDTNLSEIRLEVQLMRLSSHANILECYTAFVHDTHLWLVTPLMSKGSAVSALNQFRRRRRRRKRLRQQDQNQDNQEVIISLESLIMYILHEALLALSYIHDENGQIHRDVKGSNLLLNHLGQVKVADFGVSSWLALQPHRSKCRTFVGTPCWMAPEVMEQVDGYDYTADVWSLGITALELAKGYAPYAKFPPMKVLILTIQEEAPNLDTYNDDDDDDDDDEEFSTLFRQFIDWCLQKNPKKRPSCSELLRSKHFAQLNREQEQEQLKRAIHQNDEEEEERQVIENDDDEPTIPRFGHAPVSISTPLIDNDNDTTHNDNDDDDESDRPAGTTWVFADGSQVLAKKATTSGTNDDDNQHHRAALEVEDVLEELDQFGKEIGGENYQKKATTTTNEQEMTHKKQNNEEEEDDLNDFMDELEKTMPGEHFEPKLS